ncbi:MAG: DUF4256 domain-containing protein [Notoacmeibacter sp.]
MQSELLETLKDRFQKHMPRHPALKWGDVALCLNSAPMKLEVLAQMERTGGEPDVVGHEDGAFIFMDCSLESPAGRRSLCYDFAALDARKENKPVGSVVELATLMGAEVLNEAQYRLLQSLGEFDRKTSSWIKTPEMIRALGGALFCDRRYGEIFTYHNGADSYYAARGFRCKLSV